MHIVDKTIQLGYQQTMAITFSEICEGKDPWVPLGNFMNHWFDYSKEQRQALVDQPIATTPLGYERWAAFCAASVEWFCQKYGEPCPAWVHKPQYLLKRRWYYSINAHRKQVRAWLRSTTPEAFTKRNIYCGNRVYANKWEAAERFKALHQG